MKRALTLLSVCLILVAMNTTVQAQDFTPLSSNLISHEYNGLGLDGNQNRYFFTSYGIQHLSLYMVEPDTLWEQIGLVATPGLSYEGAYRVFDGDDGFVIAEGDLGVSIVDVWNLGANFYTVSADLGGACTHVTNEHEDSSRVYCAVEGIGIVALEVPDSSTISVLGTYSDPNLVVHDLKYHDGYLYVAADTAGLLLIDVSDPANPSYFSEWDYDGVSMLGFDFHPANDSVYVALGNPGVVTIDITDPSNPTLPLGGQISTTGPALDIATYTVISGGNFYYYLMIAEGDAGFQIFYDEIPGSQASSGATVAYCNSVYVQGNTAFFFEGVNGFEIWNVSAAYSPSYIWHHVTPGGARSVAVDGDNAYVANFTAGMTVLGLTDPANPDSLTTVATPYQCWDVLVNGTYAYALDMSGELSVYDVTYPGNPIAGTPASGPAGFRCMDVWGDSIYIGSYNGEGVHIVDIITPSTPAIGDTVDVPFDIEGVTAADGRLYVAANDGGVLVYELMAPSAPAYLGEYATTGNAKMVAANGNTIYVAAGDEGVLVLDVTDPASIISITTITLSGDAQGVTFANDVLYIAHTTSGVSSYDVSTPASPVLIATYDSPGMAYELALYGTGYAYLADGYSLEAYSVTGAGIITSDPAVRPASFAINGNYPNPFNASTVLSFSLPAAGQVRVEVFDMMGRLVANLYEGNLGIGEHKLHWNADAFTSGLYFAQVTSPLGQKVQKMVLLK